MKRLALLGLVLGLMTVQAQAQTSKKSSKSNDGWGSSSNDGWGAPAPAPKKAAAPKAVSAKPATTKAAVAADAGTPAAAMPVEAAPAPAAPTATDAAGAASGGFGGNIGGGAANDARPIEGTSVAPGSALRPMSRTRYDYRGRPIEQKPSMRPRE
ncbi:hypothetical protein [Hymenobacter jeollabukensis]|uniref:Translation initiation factor IF-2 n=1 Tax=Hymenobacter jeollabukensis TaxID=2025313 RepID=A0A5R8WS86_9BACT|nr:hypothetical protein [Hymenobacter jeollabukensis]TLM94041.1 hypothetical protein FDY95_08420 [Hymenobacter jeollabukensis]